MASVEGASWMLVLLAVLISMKLHLVSASDPDPVQDIPSIGIAHTPHGTGLPSNAFVFEDIFTNGVVTHGPGGLRVGLTASSFPAMAGQGITYVQFKMNPCGVNLPHTHPRAAEILTLISGGPLQVGFVDTEGNTHVSILNPGDVTIFPRGLMHFELNVGFEIAFFISALNSENPGTLVAGNALFKLPKRALAASINVDLDVINKIEDTLFEYGHELQNATMCTPGKNITTDF